MMVAAESMGYKVWKNNNNKADTNTLYEPEHDNTDSEVDEDKWSHQGSESDWDSESGDEEE